MAADNPLNVYDFEALARSRMEPGAYDYFAAGAADEARLHGLDGFVDGPLEVLLRRKHRGAQLPYVVSWTARPLDLGETVTIDGIRCLSAERLIVWVCRPSSITRSPRCVSPRSMCARPQSGAAHWISCAMPLAWHTTASWS